MFVDEIRENKPHHASVAAIATDRTLTSDYESSAVPPHPPNRGRPSHSQSTCVLVPPGPPVHKRSNHLPTVPQCLNDSSFFNPQPYARPWCPTACTSLFSPRRW